MTKKVDTSFKAIAQNYFSFCKSYYNIWFCKYESQIKTIMIKTFDLEKHFELEANSEIQKQPPKVFCVKAALKNFAKFTGNTCATVSEVSPVPGLSLQLYWKRGSGTGVYFAVNFATFLRTRIFIEHLW